MGKENSHRFDNYEDFNTFIFEQFGIDDEILWYIAVNEPELLSDYNVGEAYKDIDKREAEGYNSAQAFKETLNKYFDKHKGNKSKGMDIIQLIFEGYNLDEIQELYELTDEEIRGDVKDINYKNY